VQQLLAAAMVIIRIYNYAALPAGQIDAASATADGIFHDAGISSRWIDCRVPGATSGAACAEALGETEFVLRLLESPHPEPLRGSLALGSSLLDGDAHGGVLITIDPYRTSAVAAQAGVDRSLLLGRAIAHEVGHLLLGTPQHAPTGLMRAFWSQRELRENREADWRFSPGEASVLRQSLATRARAGN
jgi:hypothetical protein